MIDLALVVACAPNVAPSTIQAIIRVESNGNPLALNVNTRGGVGYPLNRKIKSTREAVSAAKKAISAGHTVDMGYMQVNSANLEWLGYTVEDMIADPCKNLAAGAKVLSTFYATALKKYGSEQIALRAALSAYNTGNFTRGFSNGYVQKYVPAVASSTNDPHKAETAVDFSKRRPGWGKVIQE